MTSLFPLDLATNDRLLLEAEQRRQDLIDYAVRRFAPERTDDPDVQVIHLYSTNQTLRAAIRTICGNKTILVEHVTGHLRTPKRIINEVPQEGVNLTLPSTADLVATKTNLTKKIEWLAARLNAQALVLPEATDYLLARLKKQNVLVIVGGEQA